MNLTSEKHENRVVSTEDLLKQLKWRYATKAFDPKRKISSDDWKIIEEALVLSPSSFGLQPWKFFVVTNQDLREKLVAASWSQRQVADASHTVVFAIKENMGAADVQKYIDRIVEVRGGSAESLDGYKKMMEGTLGKMGEHVNAWATKQVYIALGNFMTSAAVLGIDTCPMEGLVPEKYDEILGLKGSGYKTIVVGVAGYRSQEDKYAHAAKVRFKSEDVVEHI